MFKKTAVLIASLILVFTIACNQAPPAQPDTHDADIKAIKDTEAAWVAAFATKDLQKATSFYANDGSLLVSNAPALNGIENIKNGFKDMIADPNFSLTFTSDRADVAKSGELGYSQGAYTLVLTDPKTKKPFTDKGKYVTVWKKQADGSWKAIADMVSSDLPPAPAGK